MYYEKESKKARRHAIRYLVYRDRSRHEIAYYLKGKGFSASAVGETLAFLEDNDYVNDPRFALQFGRSRIENKKMGKLRLERELKNKGLENQIISETLSSATPQNFWSKKFGGGGRTFFSKKNLLIKICRKIYSNVFGQITS